MYSENRGEGDTFYQLKSRIVLLIIIFTEYLEIEKKI